MCVFCDIVLPSCISFVTQLWHLLTVMCWKWDETRHTRLCRGVTRLNIGKVSETLRQDWTCLETVLRQDVFWDSNAACCYVAVMDKAQVSMPNHKSQIKSPDVIQSWFGFAHHCYVGRVLIPGSRNPGIPVNFLVPKSRDWEVVPGLQTLYVGGGEGEAATSQVHATRAAEGDQEGTGNGEGRQGCYWRQVPWET